MAIASTAPLAIRISDHLVTQWVARVAPSRTRQEAGAQIMSFIAGAHVAAEGEDGVLYLAHLDWPGWRIIVRQNPRLGPVAATVHRYFPAR